MGIIGKKTSSNAWNIPILDARENVEDNDTKEMLPLGIKVSSLKGNKCRA